MKADEIAKDAMERAREVCFAQFGPHPEMACRVCASFARAITEAVTETRTALFDEVVDWLRLPKTAEVVGEARLRVVHPDAVRTHLLCAAGALQRWAALYATEAAPPVNEHAKDTETSVWPLEIWIDVLERLVEFMYPDKLRGQDSYAWICAMTRAAQLLGWPMCSACDGHGWHPGEGASKEVCGACIGVGLSKQA